MTYKTDNLLDQANLDEHHSSFGSAEKMFGTEAEAERIFSNLKAALFNINEWNEHSMISSFRLFNEAGQEIEGEKISVGTFLQISLKGTVKYDWVRVIDIFEAADEFIITVKPTYDPTAETIDKGVVSHFFTDESTNNFCLLRKGKTVSLNVIGLEEKLNTSETKNTLEAARNIAVNVGSYLGVQTGEWEKFCHDFLENAPIDAAKTNV